MKIRAVTVDLNDNQMELIAPVMSKVTEAALEGKPGMLLAQVFDGKMKVFFATAEQAKKMQEAMGSPVGMTNAPSRLTDDEMKWTCPGCGKEYGEPANVPARCPDCGEYADDEPE